MTDPYLRTNSSGSPISVLSLPGLTAYRDVHQRQLDLVELRARDEIGDTVIFCEHPAVVTRGRGLQFTGTPRPRHSPPPIGMPSCVEVVDIERGGDLTYHGPGQLVFYPIIKLGDQHPRDVERYLRWLEAVVVRELGRWGISAGTQADATGVWAGGKKLASIGIAVRKWVTYHGVAINVVNDLAPFGWMNPCGFAPEVMGRVLDYESQWPREIREAVARDEWRAVMERGILGV